MTEKKKISDVKITPELEQYYEDIAKEDYGKIVPQPSAGPDMLEALRHAQALILQNLDWRAVEHGVETVNEIAVAIKKAELTRSV